MPQPTPRLILETLLPHLRVAAAYADQIQSRIQAHPAKEAENFFGAALSDADLSIQTLVEVVLLGAFPQIRFYGEEYEKSYNTHYFRSIELGEQDDYLVTLDPIDGTQFYLDGHSNYLIILGVLNRDEFEAVLAIMPGQNIYYYALRGQGCWRGNLADDLADCVPLRIAETPAATRRSIILGWGVQAIEPKLKECYPDYEIISIATTYSKEQQIPNYSGMLSGELAGAIMQSGKFIDGAALAFLAQEAGCIVTTHDGSPPPPLHTCENYGRPGLVIAASAIVHQQLLEVMS